MNRFTPGMLTLILFLLLFAAPAGAQGTGIFVPGEVQAAFDSGTRSTDGEPGPAYWQNSADYEMHIRFDPISGELVGRETIVYRNESPDSLRSLVLKLMSNLFKRGSARDNAIAPEDVSDGVTLTAVELNGEPLDPAPDREQVIYLQNGSIVMIPGSVPPGGMAELSIDWRQVVNRGSHGRSGGVDSTTWFNAYFFPRIAVRDDIDGWDVSPHLGTAEFYNDFGDFEVTIEVQDGYLVWATGVLQNPDEVLAPDVASRYREALESDDIVHIVDAAAIAAGALTTTGDADGSNFWRFRADYVPDFAFAVSNHYLWDASSLVVDPATGRRVLIDAAYDPSSSDFYEVAEVARNSIDYMSRVFPGVPFPYPQETVFNGLSEMEYPMMVN
ncbi:MAG: M1 family metallopeptidase, partial [Gemmatimonadota bacterium]